MLDDLSLVLPKKTVSAAGKLAARLRLLDEVYRKPLGSVIPLSPLPGNIKELSISLTLKKNLLFRGAPDYIADRLFRGVFQYHPGLNPTREAD
ncbi:MAG: hypothetical protein Q8O33_11495 [Pseudomonadota bacterium]|nr:hypothetical protein [Pseudomonadota bacterium]